MNSFTSTVERLFIDDVEQAAGVYTGASGDWIGGTGELTVTTGSHTYNNWLTNYRAASVNTDFSQDPDNDGVSNGLEYYFGTDPMAHSQSLQITAKASNVVTFSHPVNSALGEDVSAVYRWSKDLITHNFDGDDDGNGTTVNFVQGTPNNGVVEVTANITGQLPEKLFFSIKVSLNP